MSPRPSRPPLARRLPIALAAGALAVATAVTPAVAADDPNQGGGQGNWSQQGGNGDNNQQGGNGNADQQGGGHQQGGGNGNQQGGNGNQQGGGDQQGGNGDHQGGDNNQQGGNNNQGNQAGGHHQGNQGQYKGVVTANSLALRSAPNRGSQIIRYAHKGDVVSIFCKVPGDKVKDNPLWYLLTDGTWAWGPAAHIDNLGPAPRWC
ncbi:hypothetical protein GCM10010415_72980 [Streptomyces atrovirens]|uniref:SH3 domain-containing protein n=1 Tax=Streptomyces atrovirens TaxID=285556 RepID=A0ABW0E144_9ACTN